MVFCFLEAEVYTIDNKDQFGNIRNVVLGPSPFKNVDLREILKNDEVEMLNRPYSSFALTIYF